MAFTKRNLNRQAFIHPMGSLLVPQKWIKLKNKYTYDGFCPTSGFILVVRSLIVLVQKKY